MRSGSQQGMGLGDPSSTTPMPDGLETTADNRLAVARSEEATHHDAVAASRGTERRLRQVMEAFQQGVWTLDLHGFTTSANTALEQLLGVDPGTLLARHALDLVVRTGRPQVAQALTRCRQHQRESLEVPLAHASGQTVWARVEASALHDERGAVSGFLLLVADTSERKRSEQEKELLQARLAETQKHESLGTLAGGIAHDFNNLLAVIIGQIEIASVQLAADRRRSDLPLVSPAAPTGAHDVKVSGALSSAISAAQRAAGLTRQLLDYAGRSQLQERAILLDEQVRHLARTTRDTLPSNVRVEVATDTPPALSVLGDPERLEETLAHLLSNAAEAYNGNPGTVFVRVGRERLSSGAVLGAHPPEPIDGGDFVFVEVRDQGYGMSPATLARVFEPFFTTKTSGRGLGLAACMGVAKAHRGFLTAQSEVYRGSTFRLYLPFVQVPLEAEASEVDAEPEKRKQLLKVLVVDDEPMIRTFARSMLEMEGYSVEDAASGAEALEILRSRTSEIGGVLLDLSMPGMDGSVVLSTLRTFAPDLPVVIQTGYSAEATAQRMAQWRVRGVLQKPYRANQLLESIHSMFDTRG